MNKINEKKDIAPINSNCQFHGYQEWYDKDGKLYLRVTMKHGLPLGYEEWHFTSDLETNYYIK